MAKLNLGNYADPKNITRQKFLARISSEIGKRGGIDVLRRGISDGPLRFEPRIRSWKVDGSRLRVM